MFGALRTIRSFHLSANSAGMRGHGNALQWYAPNITPEARYSNVKWRSHLARKTHNDLGEWTRKNLMLYPPQKEGEPARPCEVYWGRAQIAMSVRPMHRLW